MLINNSLELAILNLNRYCSHPERLDRYFFFVALRKVLHSRKALFKADYHEPFDLNGLIDQMLLWYSSKFKVDSKYFLSPGRDELITTDSPEEKWRDFFRILIKEKSFPIEDPIVYCLGYEKEKISLQFCQDIDEKLHHYIFNICPEVHRLLGGVRGYGCELGITQRSLENVNVDYWRNKSVSLIKLNSIQKRITALGDIPSLIDSPSKSTIFDFDPIEFKLLKDRPLEAANFTHVRFNAEKMAGHKGEPFCQRFLDGLWWDYRYSSSPNDFLCNVCIRLKNIFCQGKGIEFGCAWAINQVLNTGTKLDPIFYLLFTGLGFDITYDEAKGLFKVKSLVTNIRCLMGPDEDEDDWYPDEERYRLDEVSEIREAKNKSLKVMSIFSREQIEFYKSLAPEIAALKVKNNPIYVLFLFNFFGFNKEEISDWIKEGKKFRYFRF